MENIHFVSKKYKAGTFGGNYPFFVEKKFRAQFNGFNAYLLNLTLPKFRKAFSLKVSKPNFTAQGMTK